MSSKHMRMQTILMLALLIVLGLTLTVARGFAQGDVPVDPTSTVDPIGTNPIIEPPVYVTQTDWGLVVVLVVVVIIIAGLAVYTVRAAAAGVPPGTIDKTLTDSIRQLQTDNRVLINKLEQAYQQNNATLVTAVNAAHKLLESFAPLLEWTTVDEAVGDVITDITSPGDPVAQAWADAKDAAGATIKGTSAPVDASTGLPLWMTSTNSNL